MIAAVIKHPQPNNCHEMFLSLMEQHTLKNVKYCLNTNIYSYLDTSGG